MSRPTSGWPTRGEFVTALVAGIVACSLPLARTLGYESALILAILGSAIALRRGLAGGGALSAPAGAPGRTTVRDARREFLRAVCAGWSAAAIPLILLSLSTRLWQGCRLGPGLALTLFIAAPAVFLAAGIGLATGAVFRRRSARAVAIGFLLALFALQIVWQALAGTTIPHSFPFGFASVSGWSGIGTVRLDLPASYFLQRALAVAVVPLLLLIAVRAGSSRAEPVKFTFALAFIPVLLAAAMPARFGLTSGAGVREAALSGVERSGEIILRFEPGGPVAARAPELAARAEADRAADAAAMNLREQGPAQAITIWAYDSPDRMRRFTGADGFIFTLPWRREVHTLPAEDPSQGLAALRHELVHVLAGAWTRSPLRICLNQALLEGTAEAIARSGADPGRSGGLQREVAAACRAGRLPGAGSLFAPAGFAFGAGASTPHAYLFSASFVGFLLTERGPAPVAAAYGGAAWQEAFGVSMDALDSEWRAFLMRIDVTEAEVEGARSRFDPARHPAFVNSPCPRVGRADDVAEN